MKLTSKGRYAVTAILDLAFHAQEGPVSLAHISRRQDISLSYLEQLFTRLRKHKLVKSTRGPGGGYALNRPAGQIAVAEVIAAVDEHVDNTRCSGEINCHGGHQCLTHELWDELSNQIFSFLDAISLQDLLEEEGIRAVAVRQDGRTQTDKSQQVAPPKGPVHPESA
ncbi:MAG: Rrf2 family transcriptional regulator [Gammaproteobacteria bacterium]|nr:Rrf2 family transcriptional regulator [Gammaproteobacteria bacterium]